LLLTVLAAVVHLCSAENPPKVALDTNESLFTVLTAINSCGYDEDLAISHPLRQQIRGEVTKNVEASDPAKAAETAMCQFYADHQNPSPSRTSTQYVSLALYLNPPPSLAPKVKDTDLPPDAAAVVGIVPLMAKFYEQAGLHAIWERHHAAYDALTGQYHEPLSKMLFDSEVYLKLPSAGYLGRGFTVYLDPMGAAGQVNARNYGSDYFVVISPGETTAPKIEQIRHTYLHYLLDPLALKYPAQLKRLEPLLEDVKTAPMDDSFKSDMSLLVTECLIRAVEIRTEPGKIAEEQKQKAIEQLVEQGFILTPYFYDALVKFEKDPAGLKNVYGQMLADIDVRKEDKQAGQVEFATTADPELLHPSNPLQGKLLATAEQKLSDGDVPAAQKLAQQAIDEHSEDAGRAFFILARAATMSRDIQGARTYFQRTLEVAREPKVVAWSHIYLGRIFDLQEDRAAALDHYRAALSSGGAMPEVKAAAERGIQQPYEPPSHPQP
jgi:tetratricopeptide (TPR) repeat protein